jgi:biopolymer transport protein ExbB
MMNLNFIALFVQLQLTDANKIDNLGQLLMKGGVIMIPIVLLSVLSIYIFIEKYIYIQRASKIDTGMMMNVLDNVKSNHPEKALEFVQNSETSAGRIFESGLTRIGKPVKEVESFMESTTNLEISIMEKDTGYLGIIAGVAPMLGFVGTISGVIKIFYNISLADNISIGIIAGGLYQKMISSGTGLIVGVIAYCGYHYLQMMIDRFTIGLQRQVIELTKVL